MCVHIHVCVHLCMEAGGDAERLSQALSTLLFERPLPGPELTDWTSLATSTLQASFLYAAPSTGILSPHGARTYKIKLFTNLAPHFGF